MDKAAFLRIKFTPLLQKVKNKTSKCCLEIVPELSGFQNLEEFDWKDIDLMEYKIPMTYKITIKKQNHEIPNQVYHSCVDLLATYSESENDTAASVDIKKIRSDSAITLHPCIEKYDLAPRKTIPVAKNKSNKISKKTTCSMQTLDVLKPASYNRSTVDKCFDTNFQNDEPGIQPAIRDSKSEESLKTVTIKYDNETTTLDLPNETEKYLTKTSSTDSFYNCIENLNRERSQRKQLSLSPICSVNTWDAFSAGPMHITDNTSSYTFCNGDLIDNCMYNIDNYSHSPDKYDAIGKETKNIRFNEFIHVLRVDETQTNIPIQKPNERTGTEKEHANPKKLCNRNYISVKDVTTSMSQITMTTSEVENKSGRHDNKLYESRSNFSTRSCYKTTDLSNNEIEKHNFSLDNRPNVFYNQEKYEVLKIKNTNMTNYDINYHQNYPERLSPAVRVAQMLKNIEAEIHPLKLLLHEIKCKCIYLGLDLFVGEFMPSSQKNVTCKPVCNFEYFTEDLNISSPPEITNSNRVVYTVLFNG